MNMKRKTQTNNPSRQYNFVLPRAAVLILLLGLSVFSPLQARNLLGEGYQKSKNEFQIRTDGLACYFCAYGLERFFRQTKKIYSMDISLKKGLVSVNFVKNQPIPSANEIKNYIHDAGFTARTIRARLYGKLSKDGKWFWIAESDQRVPVADAPKDLPRQKEIHIAADVSEHPKAFVLSNIKLAK